MRIGFDVSQTGCSKAGCGYFAYGLARQLEIEAKEEEFVLYPTFGDHFWDPAWRSETWQATAPNFSRSLGHETWEAQQNFWRDPPDDFESQLGDPDVVHSNNFFCPVGLSKAGLVFTLYDLAFMENPQWSTELNRTACFSGIFNASIYADRILAISKYTREHFLGLFPRYSPDRVRVIYPASRFEGCAGESVAPASVSLAPRAFWLHVSTLEPRKNQKALLSAYAGHRSKSPNALPLVLAGGQGWLMDDFERVINDLDLKRHVILLGYVNDATLRWLYENCFAFIYPSLFEGFGLPVLEAMSLGAPVIASNCTSLPEIVDDAGLLVDPSQPEALVAAMDRLGSDGVLRQELAVRARERAALFSWSRTANEALELYHDLAASSSSGDRERMMPASLRRVFENWNTLGHEDPLWAVLTDPTKKGGRWSPKEFFEVGSNEVGAVLRQIENLGVKLHSGRALDFGCGAGRLSQALAERFSEVHGVDIAPSMVETARRLNLNPDRCFFHLNLADDLSLFESGFFDLVLTLITLQHLPKRLALGYIVEFVRVTRPGGLMVFQAPDSRRDRPKAAPAGADGGLHSDGQPVMLMSGIPRAEVLETLNRAGARLLDAAEDGSAGAEWLSYRYFATKEAISPSA